MSRKPKTPEENAGLFYHLIKSYNNLDNLEIRDVVRSQLSLTQEEQCFVATYYRARGNVETLLVITDAKHFQAAAMLARALFELAVDIRMLELVPNASIRMLLFDEVERLRSARQVVAYKESHPDADIDLTSYTPFIAKHGKRIDSLRRNVWPKPADRFHWTGVRLADRVKMVGAPIDKIYQVDYPRLSWYVHSGVTGVVNFPPEAFVHLCANAFYLAADSYREILEAVIRKFKLNKGVKKLSQKIEAAKLLPFNEDPEIEAWLARSVQD